MRFRGPSLIAATLCLAGAAFGQDRGKTVIRTETRVVLVDTVVTDKKGVYLHDLTAKEFRVWEDNKEQAITSVTMQATAAEANGEKSYMLLLFDNANMDPSHQRTLKTSLLNFLDAKADPNRVTAVSVFSGGMRMIQNFTTDADRVRAAIDKVPIPMTRAGFSSSSETDFDAPASAAPGTSPSRMIGSAPQRGRNPDSATDDQMARAFLYALGAMARNMSALPGRKALVLLSNGFSIASNDTTELTAAVNACNRSNVAVYVVDPRGLSASRGSLYAPGALWAGLLNRTGISFSLWTPLSLAFQGRSGTPSTPTTPTAPTTPTTPTAPTAPTTNTPSAPSSPGGRGGMNTPSMSDMGMSAPTFQETRIQAREVMETLAGETGGFVIRNTNDLTKGLLQIGSEQREYYLIAYTPPESKGGCHSLKVKVSRGGAQVRSRNSYCYTKPIDILAGTPAERDLEGRISGTQQTAAAKAASAKLQLPFLYTAPNTARLNVAMELPSAGLRFEKVKGKFHAEMNILALAYRGEGDVAARFSDVWKLDLNSQSDVDAFLKQPLHYDNQFDIAPGKYDLKVAYGQTGREVETLTSPLVVEPYDGRALTISALALSKQTRPGQESDPGIQMAILDGRAPMFARGILYIPTGDNRYAQGDTVRVYAEVYEPELLGGTPEVKLRLSIKDAATGQVVGGGDVGNIAGYARPGTNVIPLGMSIPLRSPAGKYRLEYEATSVSGKSTRSVDFEVN